MKIHTVYSIEGKPVLGTFGGGTLEDLKLVRQARMNLVVGGASLLDPTTPEGKYCLRHGIKVMTSIARHIHGRPRLARWIEEDERDLPIASGRPLPGPEILQLDDELIRYEKATDTMLYGCERGFDGTQRQPHELSTILFWPRPLEREIMRIKDSPNLWGYWALDDSPGYALSAMKALYKTVKETDDKGHAVCGGYSGATTLRNFALGTCDMIALYFYPFLRDGYDRAMNSLDTQWILTDARKRVPGIPFVGIYQAFWESDESKRLVNKQGALSVQEIREQMEDFVREGASGLIAYGVLGEGGDLLGWNSDSHLRLGLRSINEKILSTRGLPVPPEPGELARRRIQPHGFYDHPLEVPGMVPSWYIIGPFDAPNGSIDSVFPPDTETDLKARYPGKRIEACWKKYPAYAGTVGLLEIYGSVDYVAECIAYATCTVTSPRTMKVQMRFGSDDDGLVRLSGKEVFRHEGMRGVHFDSDILPVLLKRGQTIIQVKLYNREGQWGFFLRFTDAEGKPVKELSFSPETTEQ